MAKKQTEGKWNTEGLMPKVVADLVERFERNRDAYQAAAYNETQTRREFIDPMFKALGWDVDNEAGHGEAYKDVIHEDAVKVAGATKAPDYGFRVGSARKFFLEAKKPAVKVKTDAEAAYQLRRYGWSAKLPLNILTNFAEFAIYDGRIKPKRTDKASTGRILYLTFDKYQERWDEIASVFSKDAVYKGSFDKYAASMGKKRGTTEVDAAFLAEIETWRVLLAHNIALRNRKLSQRELNFAVGRTIDRIIFLRICEDRGIERYEQLRGLLNGDKVYARLFEQFQRADERYNSGLFHFHKEKGRPEAPDELSPRLKIDDKPLKEIIRGLYYPESPYEFAYMPAEILGQVYEQFLGKVIRLTKGHRAVVEDKPEVRKAGGVYYTPSYIVDYIVEHTVGKLLIRKSPTSAAKLKILDPACGSGSFLLGAYQYLLDWHLEWYRKHEPKKHARGRNPKIYQAVGDELKLTTTERKRILLNNIYGVDIDQQAVEVTKLSLLLKVLEEESGESLRRQFKLYHERALPDLAGNIKCGNSLIGPDFYRGRQNGLFDDEEEQLRINAFDWPAEFPDIFRGKKPGFDAVIGNPPYVRQETISGLKDYFSRVYEAFDGVADLYTYFMERSIKLLRDRGLFSLIVSSSFLRTTYGEPLRRVLKNHAAVLRIVDFGGLAVFENAKDTYVCIPLFVKAPQPGRVEVSRIRSLEFEDLNSYVSSSHFTIPHDRLSPEAWSLKSDKEASVFAKIVKAGEPLGEYVAGQMFYGIKTGFNKAFVIDSATRTKFMKADRKNAEIIKPLIGGRDIRHWRIEQPDQWLIVTKIGVDMTRYAAVFKHLKQWQPQLMKRQDQGNHWWELRACAYYDTFDNPKLVFPDIAKGPRFCLDSEAHYLANTAYCLGTDDLYLLGVLNSQLFWFAISNISIPFGIRAGQYRYRLIYQYMEKVPIRVINFDAKVDKQRHDRMVTLVARMLDLHKKLPEARTPHQKTVIQRSIDATDREIDELVYDLYGLTKAEIKIVEEATSGK